ncbi:hypothetical protein DID77_00820 [Candidatus Marinamargulisbacteria bacterium SCGC AG-439-L15]|nr:hypothetical protein DID77_00820 [Candidatus Marinamargulisbacteria bacterium SCGC AG-439-L15]
MLTKQDFTQTIQTQKVVSLYKQVVMDTETALATLLKFSDHSHFVFFESISANIKHDRFSYFGFDPHVKIICLADKIILAYASGKTQTITENLYDFLNTLCKDYQVPHNKDEKFYCGLMGYMSYECMSFLEDIPLSKKRDLNMPFAEFILPRNMIIIDNLFNTVSIVRNVFQDPSVSNLDDYYDSEVSKLNTVITTLLNPPTKSYPPIDTQLSQDIDPSTYDCNFNKEEFIRKTKQCKEYIKKGDIFQIQVSRRVKTKLHEDPSTLYRQLRNHNPSPFLFYLRFEESHLMGASPEILVGVSDNKMTIRPLAGTRKRFSSHRTEQEIEDELLSDEKERAEHIMLVDLARNDIGRACEIGSVHVNELMSIEKYRHVIHMASEVEGTLKPNCTAIDALKYGFPAGTVSGTPKIRAMEIISELESIQREFYSGGVIFIDFQNNLKSSLIIRSMYAKNGHVYTQAAAGIVADSIPELEYKETENKMRACLKVMTKKSSDKGSN